MGQMFIDTHQVDELERRIKDFDLVGIDFARFLQGNYISLEKIPQSEVVLNLLSGSQLKKYPSSDYLPNNRLGLAVCKSQVSRDHLHSIDVEQIGSIKFEDVKIEPGMARQEVLGKLRPLKHVSHTVVIIDRFFKPYRDEEKAKGSEPSHQFETIARLLQTLLDLKKLKEVIFIVDQPQQGQSLTIHDLEQSIRKEFQERLGLKVNCRLFAGTYPFDHDRYIITEFLRIYSGDSFGYLSNEKVTHTKGTLLSYDLHLNQRIHGSTEMVMQKARSLVGFDPFDVKP
jgi:hypothetical protein